jgi:hypothetical protein
MSYGFGHGARQVHVAPLPEPTLWGPPVVAYEDTPALRPRIRSDQFNLESLFDNVYGSDITFVHHPSDKRWHLHSHVFYALRQSIPTQDSLDALSNMNIDAQHVGNMFALVYGATSQIVAVSESRLKDLVIMLHLMDGLMMEYSDYVFLATAMNTVTSESSQTIIVQIIVLLDQLISLLITTAEYERPLTVIFQHLIFIIKTSSYNSSDDAKAQAFILFHQSTKNSVLKQWIASFTEAAKAITKVKSVWTVELPLPKRPHNTRFSTAIKMYGNFALSPNNIDGVYTKMFEQTVVTESLKQLPITLLPPPDFCIKVVGSRSVFMVHSWFLYCVWPHFKTSIEYDARHITAGSNATKEMELEDITVEQVSFFLRGLYNADKCKLYYNEDQKRLTDSFCTRPMEDQMFQLANRYRIPLWAVT